MAGIATGRFVRDAAQAGGRGASFAWRTRQGACCARTHLSLHVGHGGRHGWVRRSPPRLIFQRPDAIRRADCRMARRCARSRRAACVRRMTGRSSMTNYLEPTWEAGRALVARQLQGSVVMLNLLRFREVADYSANPALAPDKPISGAKA